MVGAFDKTFLKCEGQKIYTFVFHRRASIRQEKENGFYGHKCLFPLEHKAARGVDTR